MEVLLSKLGASLDDFLTFKHDDALQSRDHWLENLDTDMPENGIGAEAVVQLLCDEVIPFGSPVPKPGFTAFITSGAVSISAVA
jgi:aromatic-L-amino-acid decarboxylase